jgi:hypothetical protein
MKSRITTKIIFCNRNRKSINKGAYREHVNRSRCHKPWSNKAYKAPAICWLSISPLGFGKK